MILPLVPAPLAITADPAAPRFPLAGGVRLSGDADAAAALSALITARTGGEVNPSTSPGIDGPGTAGSAVTGREAHSSAVGDAVIDLRIAPGGAPESYRIAVDAASVVVTGADAAGLFYGVQTLGQLIARDAGGHSLPAVRIEDAPRFAYRGVMLDVARHFLPAPIVKAYIDRAASLKFNALHLHLTDDQGWRIAVDAWPRLTE